MVTGEEGVIRTGLNPDVGKEFPFDWREVGGGVGNILALMAGRIDVEWIFGMGILF